MILVLFATAAYLYFGRIRPSRFPKGSDFEPVQEVLNSLVLTFPSDKPSSTKRLGVVTFNKLIISDYSLASIEAENQSFPVLNIIVSFNFAGKNRKLSFPIVSSIYYREIGEQNSDDYLINVIDLSRKLRKGGNINLSLTYLSSEGDLTKEDFIKMCQTGNSEMCPTYLKLGFGNNPIEVNSYLENIYREKENVMLDSTTLIPTTIIVIP